MSLEAEIEALLESSKIGKLMKEKLIAFRYIKDNKFNTLLVLANICRLKSEYKEKSKSIEKSIVEIQRDDKNVMCSNKINFFEEQITKLQQSFM